MSNNDTIRLEELQNKVLTISEYFVDFCRKHNLRCFLCGGGVIGAIRHGGFIPWDDDLDFFMPRKDYEKLKMLWKNGENQSLFLSFPTTEYNDHNIFMTLRDSTTTMIKPYQQNKDIVHGIAIDIFPLDEYPESRVSRFLQVFWALVFQLFCAQLVPNNHGKLIKFLGTGLLFLIKSQRVRYKVWSFAEEQMSKGDFDKAEFITELCAGPKYMMKKYPKAVFEDTISVPFNETQMPIPKGYDAYLRKAFGNYMELPPVEQQQPSHEAVLISVDESYEQFKGKYYCVNHEE